MPINAGAVIGAISAVRGRGAVILLLSVGSWMAGGCVTRQSVRLESSPAGADVLVTDETTKKLAPIGKTPLDYVATTVEATLSFTLLAPGYVPKQVVVNVPSSGRSVVTVSMNSLDKDWFQAQLETEFSKFVDTMVSDLVNLHNQISKKTPAQAQELIARAKEKYRNYSTFHTIVGYFYFKQKDFVQAKSAFAAALRINPSNSEAKKLITLLDNF